MLEWLLIGYGIYKLLSREIEAEVKQEEETLEQEIEDFKVKYNESKRELEKRIEDARHKVNYENCISAHHQSVLTSNLAYSISRREKKLKNIYWDGIKKIDAKINATKEERNKLKANSYEREEKHKEYESGIKLKQGIKDHLRSHQVKSDEIMAEVKELNIKTMELKFLIRDNFGKRGLDWFSRLEARTEMRKKS